MVRIIPDRIKLKMKYVIIYNTKGLRRLDPLPFKRN